MGAVKNEEEVTKFRAETAAAGGRDGSSCKGSSCGENRKFVLLSGPCYYGRFWLLTCWGRRVQ